MAEAKKRLNINNLEELEQALRLVGGEFPHTLEELRQCSNLTESNIVSAQITKYSFEDIWNASEPILREEKFNIEVSKQQNDINKSWGVEVEKLTTNKAGVLFRAIFDYVNDNEVFITKDIFDLYTRIVDQIEFEWSKYNPKTEKYHWNYKGGITEENKSVRNSTIYKFWRFRVFERDNYTCQNKGCNQIGGELNAHHIEHFATHKELRFVVSNGLTLCKKCHKKEHSK